MPIKNETDRQSYQPGRGFPRLGKLRPGDKKTNRAGVEYPVDLDFFRVTFEPQFAHLEPAFRKLYGDQPKEFSPVYVMGQTVDEAFPTWMEAYTQSTLVRRCDGETMVKWLVEETGRHITSIATKNGLGCVCIHMRADYERQIAGLSDAEVKKIKKPNFCQRVGRLNLLLPALMAETGTLGFFTVETGSIANVRTIFQTLSDLERILGTLQGVPLVFGRAPTEMTVNIDGTRKKVTKALFYLRATDEFSQREIIGRLAGFQTDAPALPMGEPVDDDTAPDVIVTNGNGYTPVSSLSVEFDEADGVILYVLNDAGNTSIAVTSDMSLFLDAHISGVKVWEPGWIVRFAPPLLARIADHAGPYLDVEALKEYHGNVEVERPANPFGGNQK